jgi:hypothetical protein
VKQTCLVLALTICVIAVHSPNGFSKTTPAAYSHQQPATQSPAESTKEQKSTATKSTTKSDTAAKVDRRIELIKGRVIGLGVASRVTIFLNNGNERYGSIERIDDSSFQLAEVDTKQLITISYADVKKVREGYGNVNQFTGKRWNPIWAKIAVIAVGVLFAVVIPLSIPRT